MDYGLRVNIAAAIAALLLVMPTLATAADLEIPKLDVEANCELAAELSYGSRSTKLTCLRQEQEAYNGLKARWPKVPPEVREACAHEGSYQFMSFCLDREVAAEGRR